VRRYHLGFERSQNPCSHLIEGTLFLARVSLYHPQADLSSLLRRLRTRLGRQAGIEKALGCRDNILLKTARLVLAP
jgi:hypothetical protein